jgi:6-pyruvoyl-tetrahydropterin synthase
MFKAQQKTTKIFIENATLLDCAILTHQQGPQGKSWSVHLTWEGEKTLENGVLFDFSQAKKTAKKLIDTEFDHKIFVTQTDVSWQFKKRCIIIKKFTSTKKPAVFALNTYQNSIKVLSNALITELQNGDVTLLEKTISERLLKKSPQNITKVSVRLEEHQQKSSTHYFNYMHSLCHHYGNCQRFHGHSNIVEVFKHGKLDLLKSATVAKKFNNLYIISKHYLVKQWETPLIQEMTKLCPEILIYKNNLIACQYTGSQGDVAVIMPKNTVLCLEEESTIENLAQYMLKEFKNQKGLKIRAFEGIAKGSMCT